MNRRCVGPRSIGREGRPDGQGTSEVVSGAACFVGEVENPQIAVRPNAADLAERVSCLSAAP